MSESEIQEEKAIVEVAEKADAGKARFDLIPPKPLWELAEIYSYGAKKYSGDNWKKGIAWSRHYAALMRHLQQWWMGESRDEESGRHHLASVAFYALSLMYFDLSNGKYTKFDDRPKE